MARVIVEKVIKAPISDVWASWDAFGDIDKFNPGLRASRLLEGSAATGMGAKRQCDMKDGKNYVREEIVEYDPPNRMAIRIVEGTMPMKSAIATVNFKSRGNAETHVHFEMTFEPKMGLLGLMMVPMMKMMMRKTIVGILKGNAEFVEPHGIPEMA